MIKELSISGFRGFGEAQTIKFSIPDGENAGTVNTPGGNRQLDRATPTP